MIKVSELLSKRLVCLSSAEIVGTISNIIFDSKMTNGKILKIYGDDDNDTVTKYVELKKVKNLESDAAVIMDSDSITSQWNTDGDGIINPINSECYNQDGKELGIVRDITLDGNSVVSITVGNTEFIPKQLLSYSNKLLIFNDSGKPIKLAKPKIEMPKNVNPAQKVFIHSSPPITSFPPVPEPVSVPSKVPPSNTVVTRTPQQEDNNQIKYKFLLGKKLTKNIMNSSNEIIIKEKTVISEDTIALARDCGKLVQLALHAE